MPRGTVVTLSGKTTVGLFLMQRYRYLTIDQYARAANLNRSTARDQLHHMERHGLLGYFGNTGLAGHGKTPKAYYLTRRGWNLLLNEGDIPHEILGSFKEIKIEAAWSPQMYHRLRTVDLLISLEMAVQKRPHLTIINTFLDRRRIFIFQTS